MALTPSNIVELNFKAPSFALTEPLSNKERKLAELKGEKGTLVLFICNHCPYVIHIIDGIVKLANEYKDKGINLIAINSNDAIQYPDDSPEKMILFTKKHSFPFPYLYDETQKVAKSYDAACTPDFYLLNSDEMVVYRGRFDASRPGNQLEVTGEDMREAFDRLLNHNEQVATQLPSFGCNIKWK